MRYAPLSWDLLAALQAARRAHQLVAALDETINCAGIIL